MEEKRTGGSVVLTRQVNMLVFARQTVKGGGVSPDVVSLEVDDRADEVLAHNHRANLLPVLRVLTQQQTDGLEGLLDGGRWSGHRSHLDQVLLLDRLDGCEWRKEEVGERKNRM